MLHLFQTSCHTLISHLAVGMLRSALSGYHTDSACAMCQSHPCLDFIAMLSSWTTGDEKLQITISFQGVAIGWIKFGQNLLSCIFSQWSITPASMLGACVWAPPQLCISAETCSFGFIARHIRAY